jgi:hypothetical protein
VTTPNEQPANQPQSLEELADKLVDGIHGTAYSEIKWCDRRAILSALRTVEAQTQDLWMAKMLETSQRNQQLSARVKELEQERDILKACCEYTTSPCGHSDQFAHTEDGGKTIRCYVCQINQLTAENAELREEIGLLSKDLCEMEDWLLGTKQTWGACDGGKRLKERIRDLIAKEGECGDLTARVKELESKFNDERAVPYCADHAEEWFCMRNHLRERLNGKCWICEATDRLTAENAELREELDKFTKAVYQPDRVLAIDAARNAERKEGE